MYHFSSGVVVVFFFFLFSLCKLEYTFMIFFSSLLCLSLPLSMPSFTFPE